MNARPVGMRCTFGVVCTSVVLTAWTFGQSKQIIGSFPPVPVEELIPANAEPGQHGLRGEYFNTMNLTGNPALVRIDKQVDFDWGDGSPDSAVNADHFSARWTGKFAPAASGVYKFGATSDDGVRLYVNDKLIIDSWFDRPPGTDAISMKLEGGNSYDIQVEYFENEGGASCQLGYDFAPSGDTFFREHYLKHEYQIPMRDGAKLFTTVYVPKDSTTSAPIILTRTPYSVAPYGPDEWPTELGNQRWKYLHAGYILAYQDVRGTYMSEGTFVNVRPYIENKKSPRDIDETSDTYDTVEWLIRNVPHNNGRVGVSGVSYPGFYSTMSAIDAHPAVKAVSPQAPVSRWMGGDDFFHNGALLLPHAFNFFAGFGQARPQPTTSGPTPFNHGTDDEYRFFLEMGPLSNANARYLKDSIAFWNEITEHGQWDAFWEARDVVRRLRGIRPAMMFVGGWFDTENLWGALNAYAETENNNPGITNLLVMGPWSHGQWAGDQGSLLGEVSWGSKTSVFYTDSIEFPFFQYYLRGEGTAPRFEAAVFETGTNRWSFLDRWPPRNVDSTRIFLHDGGRLGFDRPATSSSPYDEYMNDPAKPVPYTQEIRHWYNPSFMVADQRFARSRPDVLSYQTDTLSEEVSIAGPILVRFFVSTSGTDCDWVVKIIDVFPDGTPGMGGYQMLLRGDVMRGKFRQSLSSPQPLSPGETIPLSYKLEDVFHTFKKGHRIMIQVQSSWFPMIDRNPGKFVDIYHAKESDFQKTMQRVYHDVAYPSHIVVLKRRL